MPDENSTELEDAKDQSSRSFESLGDADSSAYGLDREKDEQLNKAKEALRNSAETYVVNSSKCCMIFVLLLSATLVAVSINQLISGEETTEFKLMFDNASDETIDVATKRARNIFGVIKSFGMMITSTGLASGISWPFYTLPAFEEHGAHIRELTESMLIVFAPLVSEMQKGKWEFYSFKKQGWIRQEVNRIIQAQEELLEKEREEHTVDLAGESSENQPHEYDYYNISAFVDRAIPNFIYNEPFEEIPAGTEGPFMPIWQFSPPPIISTDYDVINFNLLSFPVVKKLVRYTIQTRQPILSEVIDSFELFGSASHHRDNQADSIFVQPVFSGFEKDSDIIGHVIAVIPWKAYLHDILEGEGISGLHVVFTDSCGGKYTYVIDGPDPTYVGPGDFHEEKYADMGKQEDFSMLEFESDDGEEGDADEIDDDDTDDDEKDQICHFHINVYPTEAMHETYLSNKATFYTIMVVIIFSFTSIIFLGYDFIQQRRQRRVWNEAVESNAIISSLFPESIRDQLLHNHNGHNNSKNAGHGKSMETRKQRLKAFLSNDGDANNNNAEKSKEYIEIDSKPIADFFPSATVMFADVANFTAWSSIREPSQVFTLLENVYGAFDQIARKHGVFKIETIGDCYVAVVGLPERRDDHAIVMCKFARSCLHKFNQLTKRLIVTLGPGTSELALRIGLHSGPVTAGVLRGERARFQLFGDTVNTTARIESTGKKNKIHISSQCAQLVIDAGKDSWVESRNETVMAKGKGELKTFWLRTKDSHESNGLSGGSSEGVSTSDNRTESNTVKNDGNMELFDAQSDKVQRLVNWHCEVLANYLKQIVAKRNVEKLQRRGINSNNNNVIMGLDELMRAEEEIITKKNNHGVLPVDEVVNVITLPPFDAKMQRRISDPRNVELEPEVKQQLQSFISTIASHYRPNPFHNFEHASHVTMSTVKLLSRIVAPDTTIEDLKTNKSSKSNPSKDIASELHDHTYGVTSDPLTQFAVVLSALIHDVDHRGVPNFILNKEEEELAELYKNQSVAEQNSIDIAWDALMDPGLSDLRRCIYSNENELKRFRQLVINSVIATDIFDKELAANRKKRWNKAFFGDDTDSSNHGLVTTQQEDTNRKATIVIEHLIQASDVVHTMQHWHVYRKWNERLFAEMYKAYRTGRSPSDPSKGWYSGEIGFLDNYVIPLAKKLKSCGVFGVSSDEYLNYAEENRREWTVKGEELVKMMTKKYDALYQDNNPLSPLNGVQNSILNSSQATQITSDNPI